MQCCHDREKKMSLENYHITSWVTIRGGTAFHNGHLFLERKGTDELAFVKELFRELKPDYPKFYKMDNLCKLAFVAAELLLQGRKIEYAPDEVALVFSNASSSLDTDKNYYNAIEDKSNYFPSPAVFVYTLPNIMMGEICIRHQFSGENAFFITEKFDAQLLAEYSENLLTSGKAYSVIAGWIEVNDTKWEAALFLVEPKEKGNGQDFSAAGLDRLFSMNR
jgi:hypothetical protein